MYSPVLSIPAPRVSAWVAETDPKYASAWLESLPLANSAESGREIYQALYTVNRLELRLQNRLELMAMYDQAVATVCLGLEPHLAYEAPPLGPKKRQLAEFLRRLHIEMAYGYKGCLRDLSRSRLSLRRKERSAPCIERALHHLSEVLLRSYVVYLPYPAGVWREIHELYRLGESLGIANGSLEIGTHDGAATTTISERYAKTLLLGLVNPYQLPLGAAQQVHAFLRKSGARVTVATRIGGTDITGCFLIDLEADAPPVPLARGGQSLGRNARVLDARALLQTVHGFVARLARGEAVERMDLGFDSLDSTCVDLLNRMTRVWGEGARRKYTRRQQSSAVFVCVGINAAHFYLNGQQPFASYVQAFAGNKSSGRADLDDIAFVELDEDPKQRAAPISAAPSLRSLVKEGHRINRWQLRDIGPQGMSLTRYGESISPIRVGDLVGVQQPTDLGRWRVAVVRWVKAPEANSVETGVEIMAASVAPALVQRYRGAGENPDSLPALLLPATALTRQPATLIVPRGECNVGDVVEISGEESESRQVRILRLIERTGSFEQFVYGEIVTPTLRRR